MNSRASWDETWAHLALDMAGRSRCDRTKVGCVIVSRENRVCATGYNGPPAHWRGAHRNGPMDSEDHCSYWCPYQQGGGLQGGMFYDQCPSSHAEINALMHSDRRDREGGVIFVTSSPCMTCAKAIANSGLLTVKIVNQDPAEDYRSPEKVTAFLDECGLYVFPVEVKVLRTTQKLPDPGPCSLCGSSEFRRVNWVDVSGPGGVVERLPGSIECVNPGCPPDYPAPTA